MSENMYIDTTTLNLTSLESGGLSRPWLFARANRNKEVYIGVIIDRWTNKVCKALRAISILRTIEFSFFQIFPLMKFGSNIFISKAADYNI